MSNIQLKSVNYTEAKGQPKEWILDELCLQDINLVVAKNATGKTRALNVVYGLSRILLGEAPLPTVSGIYNLCFELDGSELEYSFSVKDSIVITEELIDKGFLVLERREDNKGRIKYTRTPTGDFLDFEVPQNFLAAVVKRDKIQHPFLEPLYDWAVSVRMYSFGSFLGQRSVALLIDGAPPPDERNPDQVVGLFRKAEKECPDFIPLLKKDMEKMGYYIDDISSAPPETVQVEVHPGIPFRNALSIFLKEKDLAAPIDQFVLSSGMFRALSVLIQVNYSLASKHASCIIIDDIGEGLDFTRSGCLVQILQEKAKNANIQLIMSTNDRLVMNHVPLENWLVLKRCGGVVSVYDYQNSRELFEEFKMTGLGNFSFLEMDFLGSLSEC